MLGIKIPKLFNFHKGFALQDAMAMLRLNDLYVDSFEIKDGT
jgi:hypothetical protein